MTKNLPGENDSPWWRDGLRFECTRCGLCCRGSGRVAVTDGDIERLATHLDLEDAVFRERFTSGDRRGRVDLLDAKNGDCIFFAEGRGCTVYEARPVQCRTYPFWRSVLHDEPSWKIEGGHCEGIERGEVVPAAEIRAKLDRRSS